MTSLFRLALVCSVISLAWTTGPARAAELKVVASFSIIADFARNVGGERIALTTLVGPDGDAHVFEPSPADAGATAGADVVLVNGLELEGFLKRLVEASGTKARVVELTEGAELLKAGEEGHDQDKEANDHDDRDHGEYDPHAWQSVHNAKVYVENIVMAFCAADKPGCETYKANAVAYLARLDALDAEIRQTIGAIPADRRTVISSHDAFGYFEHEYGVRFLAPEGLATDAEASAADVAALIRQTRQDRASAIFVENITDPRLVEQIAREAGVKVGGTLYSDALSGADAPAATYIDMMRHNAQAISTAIRGS